MVEPSGDPVTVPASYQSQLGEKLDGDAVISHDSYPSIDRKIERALCQGVIRVLFTDIDATFVLGAGHSQDEIAKSHQDMRELVADLHGRGFIIIPVTGSHFQSATKTTGSVLERIEQGILPLVGDHHEDRSYTVDAYVADGGALAVKNVRDQAIVTDPHYARSVSPGDFNYESLLAKAQALAEEFNRNGLTDDEQRIIKLYDGHAESERVHLQPGTQQGYHRGANKVAFYFYATTLSERDALVSRFQEEMSPLGFQIVCCEEKDATSAARRRADVQSLLEREAAPLKYCLDIVPFTKGSAVAYFSQYIERVAAKTAARYKLQHPQIQIWACGDSGNDLALMSPAAVSHAVIVGGASQELVRCASSLRAVGKEVFVETEPTRLGPASIAAALSLWAANNP